MRFGDDETFAVSQESPIKGTQQGQGSGLIIEILSFQEYE